MPSTGAHQRATVLAYKEQLSAGTITNDEYIALIALTFAPARPPANLVAGCPSSSIGRELPGTTRRHKTTRAAPSPSESVSLSPSTSPSSSLPQSAQEYARPKRKHIPVSISTDDEEDELEEDDQFVTPDARYPTMSPADASEYEDADRIREEKAAKFRSLFSAPVAKCAEKARKVAILHPRGSSMTHGQRQDDVSASTIRKRLRENPHQGFATKHGGLFCMGCATNIGSSASSVRKHRETKKHLYRKKRAAQSVANKEAIGQALEIFKDQVDDGEEGAQVKGTIRVSREHQIFRAETLEAFVKTGVPIFKINHLRTFLEDISGLSLTEDGHLMETYLPPLIIKEQDTLRAEVTDQYLGWYWDGTTFLGEAVSQCSRFADAEFNVNVLCCDVSWVAGSVDNTQNSALVITGVTQSARAKLSNVFGLHCDGAAVNPCSYTETLGFLMPYADLNLCLPHGFNNTGNKTDTSIALDPFMAAWNVCMGKSNLAQVWFLKISGVKVQKKSEVRWWSTQFVIEESILPAIRTPSAMHTGCKMQEWLLKMLELELAEKSVEKMMAIVSKPRKRHIMWLEAATLVYGTQVLMSNSFFLEGDSFEFIYALPHIMETKASLESPLTPALLKEIGLIKASAPGRAPATATADSDSDADDTSTVLDPRLKKLLSLSSVTGMTVSIDQSYWSFDGRPAKTRFAGIVTKWYNKAEFKLVIKWEDMEVGKTENVTDQEDETNFLVMEGTHSSHSLLPCQDMFSLIQSCQSA